MSTTNITANTATSVQVAGQLEKDVLEGRHLGAEIGHPYVMLREAVDHLRHQIRPKISPGWTSKETSSTATVRPYVFRIAAT